MAVFIDPRCGGIVSGLEVRICGARYLVETIPSGSRIERVLQDVMYAEAGDAVPRGA